MDEKSLEMLEFPQVRGLVAGHTSFSASRELALSLVPLTDFDQVSRLLQLSAEARRLLATETGFTIGGVTDIRETARLAARGKVLEPPALLDIQVSLSAINQLRSSLSRVSKDFPLLWQIGGGISDLRALERRIGGTVAPTGELLDSASPELASIRRQIRDARQKLIERLEAIIDSPKGRKVIQEHIITEREGRYVIPVKMEFRREIKGIVHDVSNTGATVFIEPWATMDQGNELKELVTAERREVERILRTLSGEIGAQEPEISRSVALAAEFDLTLAKAKYARKAKAAEANIISPHKNQDWGISLVEARHPLLGDKAVPLSVEIGRDFSILVITGPNTGGKTVALKTIGLLSAMTQAGLPIPASPETRLPLFDNIFADIGDEQSIEQTLSTFSWHITNTNRIIRNSTERSLVLLDELGTSTDPQEGSALARAILRYFLSRRLLAVATTHFDDLKVFAHATPGLRNASLDFDPATLAPTYHLTVGVPGGSNALATAARLGLPEEIVADARSMLSPAAQDLETLLAGLMDEKRKSEAARAELDRERAELARRNAQVEAELKRLKAEERKALDEARDSVVREVAQLQREIRQAASDLKREKSKERIDKTRRALAEAEARLKSGALAKAAEETPSVDGRVSVGDTVRIKETDLQATVTETFETTREVEVLAGNSRFKLGLESVEKLDQAGAPIPVTSKVQLSKRTVSFELDLRGKRADEIEPLVDAYLNDAVVSNLSEVRIIHGMATGTVRRIVREMLATHPLVKSFRSGGKGEGGDGVTMVRL